MRSSGRMAIDGAGEVTGLFDICLRGLRTGKLTLQDGAVESTSLTYRALQPKALGKQLRNCHLLRPGLTLEHHQRIGTEFKDDLATGAAGSAGATLFGGYRNCL